MTTIPSSMGEFVTAIGPSATLSILQVFGGGRLYIPRPARLDAAHPVVRLLGMPLALKLAEAMGGEVHSIPTAASVRNAMRNEEILLKYRAGLSAAQIARSLGVSIRTVRYALSECNLSPLT